MTFDPGQTISEVDDGADRLEKAADALTEAIEGFERIEHDFEHAMAVERTKVFHSDEYDKPPAADVRNDLALQRVDEQLRKDYQAAKATKEALIYRFRALQSAVSARQSVLRVLGDV